MEAPGGNNAFLNAAGLRGKERDRTKINNEGEKNTRQGAFIKETRAILGFPGRHRPGRGPSGPGQASQTGVERTLPEIASKHSRGSVLFAAAKSAVV